MLKKWNLIKHAKVNFPFALFLIQHQLHRVGYAVGNNPWKTIIISLICCVLCFIGNTEYQVENRGFKNWVSQTSDAIKHKDWVDEEFKATFRTVSVLLEKDDQRNILTGEAIKHVSVLFVSLFT